MSRLKRDRAVLAVIDVQEKLAAVMQDRKRLETNIERLIHGAAILGVPVLHTEQYPQGLGPTTPKLAAALTERPIQKMCFSGYACEEFGQWIHSLGRRQVLLAGIEAHVCVYQTALDLLQNDYEVHLVVDAVSSRTAANKQLAIERMREEGAKLTSTEMALFELTERAGTDEFRAISRLIR